jgi:hypothetical protein
MQRHTIGKAPKITPFSYSNGVEKGDDFQIKFANRCKTIAYD